jgi:transcriptional regulator with XRE-family HTH domain
MKQETGNKLAALRNKERLHQSQMADIIGVSQSYYSRIEKGMHHLDDTHITILTKYFELPKDYFNAYIPNIKTIDDKRSEIETQITYDVHKEKDLTRLELIVAQMKEVNIDLIHQNRVVIDSVAALSRANENLSLALKNMSEGQVSKKEGRKAS